MFNIESLERVMAQYEAIAKANVNLVDQYIDDELQLICDYMEKAGALDTQQLTKTSAVNRGY